MKCLKNKHTEELIGKPYFTEWLRLKTKTNLPVVIFWFFLKLFNLFLFATFDFMLLWVENSLVPITIDNCTVARNNMSCIQNFFSLSNIYCSSWIVYPAVGLLTLMNGMTICQNVKFFYLGLTEFAYLCKKPVPMKERLVHSNLYIVMEFLSNISMIANVLVRTVRYNTEAHIPSYIDNITYYFAYFGFMWGAMFLIQLVPFVGYIAIVMKLMMKDTLIYIFFIAIFCIPYGYLFIRIKNYKTSKCDPDWDNAGSSIYNTFLLLFNMFNFKTSLDDDVDSVKTWQLSVSQQYFFMFASDLFVAFAFLTDFTRLYDAAMQ